MTDASCSGCHCHMGKETAVGALPELAAVLGR